MKSSAAPGCPGEYLTLRVAGLLSLKSTNIYRNPMDPWLSEKVRQTLQIIAGWC